ncbi:uncharacterized protein LOC124417017 isoform X2 [Gallus gallus]|uniref:uncharacterized protein LOC124417017 isoform X2 n=1 Tax=Gallus gallus TaxID=9031 RepID=UPI001AE2BFAB|nr:uncharacterized protein LOC124417017 isoform X2 [Gallus gallus]
MKLQIYQQKRFALCDAHCGCSGGVGSMVRVWGAMAPARFVLFLLLMAMCFRETCAAPWRAPGAGDELGAPFRMIVWIRILCLCLWDNPEALLVNQQNRILPLSLKGMLEM